MKDVSVIIVNYRTSSLTLDCIRSLFEHTEGVSFEVVVVDNHSGDGISSLLRATFGKLVRCVELPENVGFGRANNAGFSQAGGRYFFCLNPDTLLLNNALKILVDYLDAHPRVAACGGNLYGYDLRPALSYRRLFPGLEWEFHELTLHKLEPLFRGKSWRFNYGATSRRVAYVTGADLMLRREAVEQLGGFSPAFFMYYEETDLCRRLHKAGYEVHSVPEACIQHLEGQSFAAARADFSPQGLKFSEQGRLTYYRRNVGAVRRRLCNALYGFGLLLDWCLYALLRKGVRRAYAYRFRAFRALKRQA